MPVQRKDVVIAYGTSHPELAKEISKISGIPTVTVHARQFANHEVGLVDVAGRGVAIEGSVRRKHVFLVQSPHGKKLNDFLMETFIIASALKRHGATEITAVIPHFPYARQERISAERGPVSAKLVVDLLHTAGVNNIIAVDLHAKPIQGFTPESFENISLLGLAYKRLKKLFGKNIGNVVFVASDAGSAERNRKMAHAFGTPYGLFEKHRPAPNVSEVTGYVGPSLKERDVVVLDDMIDTGGTLVSLARKVREEMGAKSLTVYATHGVFSEVEKDGKKVRAQDRLNASPHIDRVFVSNTLPVMSEGKITVEPIAAFLAKVLLTHHEGGSISRLMSLTEAAKTAK